MFVGVTSGRPGGGETTSGPERRQESRGTYVPQGRVGVPGTWAYTPKLESSQDGLLREGSKEGGTWCATNKVSTCETIHYVLHPGAPPSISGRSVYWFTSETYGDPGPVPVSIRLYGPNSEDGLKKVSLVGPVGRVE